MGWDDWSVRAVGVVISVKCRWVVGVRGLILGRISK